MNRQCWKHLHSVQRQNSPPPHQNLKFENMTTMHWSIYTFMLLQLIMAVAEGQGGNFHGDTMIQWERRSKRKGERKVGERQREGSWPWLNQLSFLLLTVIILLLFNQCLLVLWGCSNVWHWEAIINISPACFRDIRCWQISEHNIRHFHYSALSQSCIGGIWHVGCFQKVLGSNIFWKKYEPQDKECMWWCNTTKLCTAWSCTYGESTVYHSTFIG